MMGRQSRQMAMIFVDIESLIPENHLLRKIERMVSFDFIYDLLAPYYPATGRPSVDPVSMFKMLLIGYLYGIKSERRLVEEVQLNIAYRWFCGFELDDTIPNHSTFSKTRTRKWQQSDLFQKAFYEIVKQCIDSGLIDGEAMAADGSYIPANVSRESWINVEIEVEQSMQSYLDSLDEELSNEEILNLNILLNNSLNGLTIQEINLGVIARLKEQAGIHRQVVEFVLNEVSEAIGSQADASIAVRNRSLPSGIKNMDAKTTTIQANVFNSF